MGCQVGSGDFFVGGEKILIYPGTWQVGGYIRLAAMDNLKKAAACLSVNYAANCGIYVGV
ncbi:MAG: hypothetical protein U1A72_03550 [Sulfuritalea sp.]|nr:hypothetical protein [Sulfuritalea sp.]